MPSTGALLLANPRRNSPVASIIARLKKNRAHRRHRGGSAKQRAHGKRIAARLGRTAKGRFTKKRNLKPWHPSRRNAKKKNSRRRNTPGVFSFGALAVRRNFGALAIRGNPLAVRMNSGLGTITGLVGKVPFLGKTVAPFVAPALVGAVGITAVHFAMQYGLPIIATYAPAFVTTTVLPYIAPLGYTVGAVVVGTAIAKLPIPFVSAETRKMVAVAAVVAGAGVDALRYLSSEGAPAMAGPYGRYGEGLWQAVPFANLSEGGRTFGESAESSACNAEYSDAGLRDAQRCPDDLDPTEGQVGRLGPAAWRRAFHPVRPDGRSGADIAFSRHAGRPGHRWGWLVRMVGFDRFVKLCHLPQAQRISFIKQLRQRALALADGMLSQQRSTLQGLMLAQ